jgi:hypothetical protein
MLDVSFLVKNKNSITIYADFFCVRRLFYAVHR